MSVLMTLLYLIVLGDSFNGKLQAIAAGPKTITLRFAVDENDAIAGVRMNIEHQTSNSPEASNHLSAFGGSNKAKIYIATMLCNPAIKDTIWLQVAEGVKDSLSYLRVFRRCRSRVQSDLTRHSAPAGADKRVLQSNSPDFSGLGFKVLDGITTS